jgi:ribosome biogenesis GTP-binding protein YsxC/EngB
MRLLRRDRKRQARTTPKRAAPSPGPTPRAFSPPPARSPSCPSPSCRRSPFVGRSNAGKSTAINVLTQQKRLAFASKTPGRTQHINLFELGPKLAADALFADLPGYGYAAVERNAKLRWQEVMAEYLAVRRSLSAIVVSSTRVSASPTSTASCSTSSRRGSPTARSSCSPC